MPKKRKNNYSAIAALIAIALFVAVPLAAPILTKDQKEEENAELQKSLEEYQKQQAEVSAEDTPAEIDESFKVAGDVTELKIIDITTGTGPEAKASDTITIKYKGGLASTGEIFDSNNEGYTNPIRGFIQGWIEGVPGMKVGGKRKLIIPSEKGYGAKGSGTSIPANADLVFEIELLAIN